MKLRVTRKEHTRSERKKNGGIQDVTYNVGDTFDGTERELSVFGDRLEKADAAGAQKPASGEPTAKEIIGELAETDNAERVNELAEAEDARSQPRKTVLEAVDAARERLYSGGE